MKCLDFWPNITICSLDFSWRGTINFCELTIVISFDWCRCEHTIKKDTGCVDLHICLKDVDYYVLICPHVHGLLKADGHTKIFMWDHLFKDLYKGYVLLFYMDFWIFIMILGKESEKQQECEVFLTKFY